MLLDCEEVVVRAGAAETEQNKLAMSFKGENDSYLEEAISFLCREMAGRCCVWRLAGAGVRVDLGSSIQCFR